MWENGENWNVLKKGWHRNINPENTNLFSFIIPLKCVIFFSLHVYRESKENSKREPLIKKFNKDKEKHLWRSSFTCVTLTAGLSAGKEVSF